MNRCVICVPIYKQELVEFEKISLIRIIDFCNKHNIINNLICIIPQSFNFSLFYDTYISQYFKNNNINENINYYLYDDICFNSINAYNNMLLLSINFYGDFCNKYEYMFSYHLDGYIFDNKFDYFLNKKYDFIGGYYLPMFTEYSICNDFNNINTEHHLLMNGGISLKNINFCINSLKEHYNYITGCELNNIHSFLNEDTFFSLFYNTEVSALDSIKFSLNWAAAETHYAINNFEYPFCCHGINKSKFLMKLVENYNKENNLDYSNYI